MVFPGRWLLGQGPGRDFSLTPRVANEYRPHWYPVHNLAVRVRPDVGPFGLFTGSRSVLGPRGHGGKLARVRVDDGLGDWL